MSRASSSEALGAQKAPRCRFSARVLERDRPFADVAAMARHVATLRRGRGVQLTACTLGWRGARPPVAAVEINALDGDNNPVALIGYAMIDGTVGQQAVEVLQRALNAAAGGRQLALDPDAAFHGAA